MVYCGPGARLIDPPDHFKSTTRHRHVYKKSKIYPNDIKCQRLKFQIENLIINFFDYGIYKL